MGAMKKFRQSIYDAQHVYLREWLIDKRKSLSLSQRQLAERLGVIHSLVGKVEKGERRLDLVEFVTYCEAMDVAESELLNIIKNIRKL